MNDQHDESRLQDDAGSPEEPNAIDIAIAKLGEGGQVVLAELCDVTPQAVNQWVRKGRVPAERVIAVERATGVSRHDLRPDIYGPPPTSAAPPQAGAAAA